MSLLDDQQRLVFAAFVAGVAVVEFQMRLIEHFIGLPAPPAPRLRLVSDLHGIAVDPEFIKDA